MTSTSTAAAEKPAEKVADQVDADYVADPAETVSADNPVTFVNGELEREATSPADYVKFRYDGWQVKGKTAKK